MSALPDLARLLCSVVVREGHSTFGIDVQSPVSAPGGECLRIDYGANHDVGSARELAFVLLGELLPSGEVAGQEFGILHDRKNGRVIVFAKPCEGPDTLGDAHLNRLLTVASLGDEGSRHGSEPEPAPAALRGSDEYGAPTPRRPEKSPIPFSHGAAA